MKDFFIIAGFQRSGSTLLYNILDTHPQIYMNKPVRPEPKFFIQKNLTQSDLKNYYNSYFPDFAQNMVYGEKSTSYIEHEIALINYKKLIPNGKVILILRNPIERAISNYKFSVDNGIETRTIEEVFLKNLPAPFLNKDISVSPFDYLERGNYASYIKVLKRHIESKDICFICLEDLMIDKSKINTIANFLNISPFDTNAINIENKVNSSSKGINISNEVFKYLKNHYKNDMKELKLLTKLDFNNWNY